MCQWSYAPPGLTPFCKSAATLLVSPFQAAVHNSSIGVFFSISSAWLFVSRFVHPLSTMENLFIGIAGIIGAGKTTLAASLGSVLGTSSLQEILTVRITRPLRGGNWKCLPWGFLPWHGQIFLSFASNTSILFELTSRFTCWTNVLGNTNKSSGKAKEVFKTEPSMKMLCLPRYQSKDDPLTRQMLKESGLMEERDYNTYIDLFSNMANFM